MTSHPVEQTIAIHILTNISRNKGNQALEFGQLMRKMRKINMIKIFIENS